MDDAPGPSFALPRGHGHGRGSVRKKGRIDFVCYPRSYLAPHAEVIVDRQYSASTDMNQSEWEIISEELTHMDYIVKREPDSDGGE
jgi:hypothetical protein